MFRKSGIVVLLPLLAVLSGAAGAFVADSDVRTAVRASSDPLPRRSSLASASDSESTGAGFLTSVEELRALRLELRVGGTPARRKYGRQIVALASRSWPYGDVGTRFVVERSGSGAKSCVSSSGRGRPGVLPASGESLYAKVIAYYLTEDEEFAEQAQGTILDFAGSSGFGQVDGAVDYSGENQCAFELSLLIPVLIESAILLEGYPEWHGQDKRTLQRWLAGAPYELTSAIAGTRKNNWGTASAFASWAIAHYLIGSDLELRQTHPARSVRTPVSARREALAAQLRIIGNDWRGDSRCRRYGAQWHGGFPDELRRGSTGCNGLFLKDKDASYDYQIVLVSHLVFHAEALKRHGNDELYRYQLDSGDPLIYRAIRFVIGNRRGQSHDWKRNELGVLRFASHAFMDAEICEQLDRSRGLFDARYPPFSGFLRSEVC